MKIILKNSSMEFRPAYAPGTEIDVTPEYTGEFALENGYYLASSGYITYLAAYVGKSVGVSDLISVIGYSKVKVSNVKSNQYAAVLAFFDSEAELQGSNPAVYFNGEDESIPGTIEVTIPEGALFMRVGSNHEGSGSRPLGPAVYKLVV